jgi:lipopolysaccharide transport system permease protein
MTGQTADEVVVLEAGRRDKHYWSDLWRHRELLFFLARRDVSVKYKQTAIGIAWAVIRPLATMLIFTLVFGRIAQLPSEGVPYSVLVFSGLVPWYLFSSAFSDSSTSLVANSNLLSKVYFPRLIIPPSAVAVALVDFMISFVLLVALATWMGFPPTVRYLAIPALVAVACMAALGLGIWFSALNVQYRDFQYLVPFILQFGLYASPIGFASILIPQTWRPLYVLNPMVGVVEGFRWAMLGEAIPFRWDSMVWSVVISTALIFTGVAFFRRVERSIVDVI